MFPKVKSTHPGRSLQVAVLSLTLLAALGGFSPAAAQSLFPVNCPGTTISGALRFAKAGDTIRVAGVCKERVRITTDQITIEGLATAVLDGAGVGPAAPEFNALVTIDGARGVTLKRLTIQNSSGEGVLGQNGASFRVENTTVQDNGFTGIAVSSGSTAELTNCTIRRNGIGMDIFTSGAAVLKGSIAITHNLSSGIDLNGQSMLEIRGGQVQVNDNGGTGIVMGGSQLAIFGFTEAQQPGSSLTVNGNTASGILVGTSSIEVFGGGFFGSGANVITVSDNGENGIWLPESGTIISPFATAKFVMENNETGINFGQNSGATIIGGLSVSNNRSTGLLADGAGSLTLVSIPPNPSAITGNPVDVDLRFGSRATFGGATVGSINCDGTALSRGSTTCP